MKFLLLLLLGLASSTLAETVSSCKDQTETSHFTPWKALQLSPYDCKDSFTNRPGSCAADTVCKNDNKGKVVSTNPRDICYSLTHDPSQKCCMISSNCSAVRTLGNGNQRSGVCLLPSFCSNAVAASSNSCGSSKSGPLACCVEQPVKGSVPCSSYYTAVERRFSAVQYRLEEEIQVTQQRFTNFIPFAMKVYEELANSDRCAPLGDCSAATYLTFVDYMLTDLTTAQPNQVINDMMQALPPATADKLSNKLAEFDGYITPEAFGAMMELLWTDQELNLRQYNAGTCADWIRLSYRVRGDHSGWRCDKRWFALMASQFCRPTRKSNLPDCAGGRGVCYVNGNTDKDGICADNKLTPLYSNHGQCDLGNRGPVAACCAKPETSQTAISFQHNEYRNVRVAIDASVEEAKVPGLIDNIKQAFAAASRMLYVATEKRAVFRTVRIILPNTWSTQKATAPASDEKLLQPEFLIKPDAGMNETGTRGDRITMNTLQIGYCGIPGLGTFMTPADIGAKFAPSQIVKHFAFNRYGVFPEFPRYEWELKMKDALNNPPGRCTQDKSTVYLKCEEDFTIKVEAKDATATASLAWIPDYRQNLHGIEKIVHFCESRDCNPQRTHNKELRNAQNLLCDKRGVMDVILESDDFFGAGTPPRDGIDPTPTFIVVHPNFGKNIQFETTQMYDGEFTTRFARETTDNVFETTEAYMHAATTPQETTMSAELTKGISSRIVLVLDKSGSMDGDKIANLKAAAGQFVDFIDSKIHIAVVTFDNEAQIHSQFMSGTAQGKSALKTVLNSIQAGGGTCIQNGVDVALNLLQAQETQGGQIILMSDGEDGCRGGYVSDQYVARIVAQGVSVHTSAITANADQRLELLATKTNGKSFLIQNNAQITDFLLEMSALLKVATQGDATVERAVLMNSVKTVSTNTENEVPVFLDKGLDSNTLVSVLYSSGQVNGMTGYMVSPKTTDPQQPCQDEPENLKMNCHFAEKPHPGTWKLRMRPLGNGGQQQAAVTVIATATIDTVGTKETFSVVGYIAKPRIQLLTGLDRVVEFWEKRKSLRTTEQAIVATVSYGRFGVLGADVTAVVTHQNGESWRVKLSDDGDAYDEEKGADLTANDGVYSAIFNKFDSKPGRYAVKIEVTAEPDKAFYTEDVFLGITKSPMFLEQRKSFRTYVEFNRVLSIGMFEVSDKPITVLELFQDLSSPGKVKRTRIGKNGDLETEPEEPVVVVSRPGRVNQLKLQHTYVDEKVAELSFSWFAVGNDGMSSGFPSYYLLNVSNNILNVEGRSDEIDLPPQVDPTLKVASFRRDGDENDTPGRPVFMTVRLPMNKWRRSVKKVYVSATAYNLFQGEPIPGANSNIVTVDLENIASTDGVCSSDGDGDCKWSPSSDGKTARRARKN